MSAARQTFAEIIRQRNLDFNWTLRFLQCALRLDPTAVELKRQENQAMTHALILAFDERQCAEAAQASRIRAIALEKLPVQEFLTKLDALRPVSFSPGEKL